MLINGYKKRQLNVNLLYGLAVYAIIIVYYKNIIKIVYIFTRVTLYLTYLINKKLLQNIKKRLLWIKGVSQSINVWSPNLI